MATTTRMQWAALALVLFLAGCADAPENDVPDGPDHTASGTVGGSQSVTESFTVPPNVPDLVVSADYSLGGSGTISLHDPQGTQRQSKTYNGGATASEPSWFQMEDPPAGEWEIRIRIEGGLAYNFAMTWGDPVAPPVEPGSAQTAAKTSSTFNGGTTAAVAAGAGLTLAVLAIALTEFGRWKVLSGFGALGLFSRLEKDEVLAHTKRDQVYQYIKDNPGPSFSDLLRELELSNGTLVHHLRILEAQEFIKPVRDGFRARFYMRGPKVVPTPYLTRTQQQVLDAIGANPGATQKELTHILRIPREAVSYHTKRLAAQGQLQVQQDGKWRRYWRAGVGPSAAPTGSPATAQPA